MRKELVPQAFNPLAKPKLHNAKPHMGGDFLTPHPTGLTADCPTLKGVDITDKGIQTLMVMAAENDVWLFTASETLNQFLNFIRGCVFLYVISDYSECRTFSC